MTENAVAAVPPGTTVASYALIRFAAVTLPASAPVSDRFRAAANQLLNLTGQAAELRTALSTALHEAVALAAAEDRRFLLALRRDVHNQRPPRPALRARLADWPERLPLLRHWLAVHDEIERVGVDLDRLVEPALRADRAALATLCGNEELRRAVALTSEDLLRAVDRAAAQGAAVDARARKSEASVLRYALRTATKTTPLSWFTQVGWGWWDGATNRNATAVPGPPVAATQVNRAVLATLVHQVLGRRDLRPGLPHLFAPGLHVHGSRLRLRRVASETVAHTGMRREEEVTLPLTGPLRHLLASVPPGTTVLPRSVAARIAARLPGPPQPAQQAAQSYVDTLIDQGVLQPAYPVDPQAIDGAGAVAEWLSELSLGELASILRDITTRTAAFADLPAADRPAALAHLRRCWDDAFAAAGASRTGHPAPVTEDVVSATPLRLGPEHGRDLLPALAALAPLYEIFDQYTVIRRLLCDQFVARFGAGGRCDSLAEFAEEYATAWRSVSRINLDGTIDKDGDPPLSAELRELARLRADLVDAVAQHAGDEHERIIPEQVAHEAARRLPGWLRSRPTSHAVFGQPFVTADHTIRFCLNHVYGGWGRFTSRFLNYFDPSAAQAVATQIADGLGKTARVAQIRPVAGFNANLHPLIVGDEVADERAWGTLTPADLQIVHDVATDQLRLQVTTTGELVNVLYLGFLMPTVLPERLVSLLTDLGPGIVDLAGALVRPTTRQTTAGSVKYRPRLRYQDVIVSRAQWILPSSLVRSWQAELDREPESAARTAVRWRNLLGLPDRLFIGGAASDAAEGMTAFLSYLQRPRSQYIDLGSPLHLRCLSRTLARYPESVLLEEALPQPQAGTRAAEVVAEIYRRCL